MKKKMFAATASALAIAMVSALFVQCGAGTSPLVGRWTRNDDPSLTMVLLEDGTGIMQDVFGVAWKTGDGRLYIISNRDGSAQAFDYSISGATLTLTSKNNAVMFTKQKK